MGQGERRRSSPLPKGQDLGGQATGRHEIADPPHSQFSVLLHTSLVKSFLEALKVLSKWNFLSSPCPNARDGLLTVIARVRILSKCMLTRGSIWAFHRGKFFIRFSVVFFGFFYFSVLVFSLGFLNVIGFFLFFFI
jgi:hypothetical protein